MVTIVMGESRKSIVVVLGMHRSGTSLITRALKVFGIELGDNLMPAIPGDNEKGFWEDVDINNLNEDLLAYFGHRWDTLLPLDESLFVQPEIERFIARAIRILQEKIGDHKMFGIKNPRMAILLPFWKKVFKLLGVDVKYIITIRNPLSVAVSLQKRNQFELEKGNYLWLEHVVSSMYHTDGDTRVVVDYDLFLSNPEKEIFRVANSLNLPFDLHSLSWLEYRNEFISQELRHNEYSEIDLDVSSDISSSVRDAYKFLRGLSINIHSSSHEEVRAYFLGLVDILKEMSPLFRYVTKKEEQVESLNKNLSEEKEKNNAFGNSILEKDQEQEVLKDVIKNKDQEQRVLIEKIAHVSGEKEGFEKSLKELVLRNEQKDREHLEMVTRMKEGLVQAEYDKKDLLEK
jgi:hypothetical protein